MKQPLLYLSLLVMISCGDTYTSSSPAKQKYLDSLNNSIVTGQLNKEAWAKTPESIAGHFFPNISQPAGGNKRYSITIQPVSAKECILSITDEGALDDDEILGERHEMNFQLHEGRWKIIKLVNSYKRRF
ncbi:MULTISPECIES: hypothetical protein [Niastella]|uniref:Lipoprotein n=1 Tax=Niastella soli TaxID=2821487 RepID=A0ABS3Z2B3_9BACT|nr:hypothetical protein [Niastella soli]MBO9204307.1 hypothetical protein [Niastella soli]